MYLFKTHTFNGELALTLLPLSVVLHQLLVHVGLLFFPPWSGS